MEHSKPCANCGEGERVWTTPYCSGCRAEMMARRVEGGKRGGRTRQRLRQARRDAERRPPRETTLAP